MRRCSGQCCTMFPVANYQLHQIQEVADREKGLDPTTDANEVVDMLIPFEGPLTQLEGGGLSEMFWRFVPTFTCKHFDGKNCGIYESRPRMCRTHGQETRCHWKECTYERLVPAEALLGKVECDDKALAGQ